jgi:hypothetical protein
VRDKAGAALPSWKFARSSNGLFGFRSGAIGKRLQSILQRKYLHQPSILLGSQARQVRLVPAEP